MMHITFLGTTAGLPTKKRSHTSIAVQKNGELVLFDCGENTQRQIMTAGLNISKISRIFLTHWHPDHSAGLISLVQTLSLLERKTPLEIYGPSGTKKAVSLLRKIGYESELSYEIIAKDIENGDVYSGKDYSVECIPAHHKIPAVSYKLAENNKPGRFNLEKAKKFGIPKNKFSILQKGASIKLGKKTIKPSQVMGPSRKGLVLVYSGDTSYSESFVKFAKNADLLICEATFCGELGSNAKEYGHCSAKEAGKIAKKAKAKQLVLTHFSPRYRELKPLLDEAKKEFKKVSAAKDFMKIEMK